MRTLPDLYRNAFVLGGTGSEESLKATVPYTIRLDPTVLEIANLAPGLSRRS